MGVFLNINEGKWVLGVGLAERDILHGWRWQVCWTVLALLITAGLQWMLLHYIHANFLQRERLGQEARQDPLTGLANRRGFDGRAQRACSQALRYGYPVSVLTLDLDLFKQINDSYGHDGGDAVLRCVAQTLQRQLRAGDIAARFGGEEFVVAMPHSGLAAAADVAERIRASFATQTVTFGDRIIRFTASFGVAQLTAVELEAHEGIHAALARADQALYRAKLEGRNRVCTEARPAATYQPGTATCR
ncbi:diguanylate cyclase (GGDEF)-like protein [Silvimonas terrae]|uniref:diguanylate cyclase n=1 Tax=Silvimonas terrae TaxID=300266 RepID=A0A840REA5_9NEIS|nr:GGDEF domain-containing protein [Silvimonas terrae]MBB5190756.1 diguanylate cyclase (GGDEF)-like protein [Silvimonas terrae]